MLACCSVNTELTRDRSGPGTRQNRIDKGAGSSEDAAAGLLAIAEGQRDADAGKFINASGDILSW